MQTTLNHVHSDLLGVPLQTLLKQSRPAQANFDHYYEGLVIAFDSGNNLAYTQASATIAPALTQHSQRMAQRIYCVAKQVYCAVGYALANVIIVVGDTGLVIIDCTESLEAAQQVWSDFSKAAPLTASLPIVAVIYSHNHTDHIGGVRAFTSPQAVASGACQIIAHSTLMSTVQHNASVLAPILGIRSAYSFGALLKNGEHGSVNGGIGPILARGKTTFIPPNVVFDQALDITLAGVRFELRHAPSETDDEIIAWLPDLGVLLSAEVVQGECLANVHTLRGTRYRDPQQWVRTLDMMRRRYVQRSTIAMVPAHGRPVLGADNVSELLTHYRDAIAFIHDQAVRLMNQGAKPDELADLLPCLPKHLAQHAWLGEYYGTVKHSVRQVFVGELGWFDGDPATLDPLPSSDRAARWLALIGGAQVALAQAQNALNEQPNWAAELASIIIRAPFQEDQMVQQAKLCKAQAFTQLAYASENINWRNWYLSAANELRGAYEHLAPQGAAGFASPDILAALPAAHLLSLLAVRLAAERCLTLHLWLILEVQIDHENTETIALEIRYGVLQIHVATTNTLNTHNKHITQANITSQEKINEEKVRAENFDANATQAPPHTPILAMAKMQLLALMQGGVASLAERIQSKAIVVKHGQPLEFMAFFSCFDARPSKLVQLASR